MPSVPCSLYVRFKPTRLNGVAVSANYCRQLFVKSLADLVKHTAAADVVPTTSGGVAVVGDDRLVVYGEDWAVLVSECIKIAEDLIPVDHLDHTSVPAVELDELSAAARLTVDYEDQEDRIGRGKGPSLN